MKSPYIFIVEVPPTIVPAAISKLFTLIVFDVKINELLPFLVKCWLLEIVPESVIWLPAVIVEAAESEIAPGNKA